MAKLGLTISETYLPGRYFVIAPTDKLDLGKLEQLKKMKGVRYVEENQMYSVKPDQRIKQNPRHRPR